MKNKFRFRILELFGYNSLAGFYPQKLVARSFFRNYFGFFWQHNPALPPVVCNEIPISFKTAEEALAFLREKHGLKENELVDYKKKHFMSQTFGY